MRETIEEEKKSIKEKIRNLEYEEICNYNIFEYERNIVDIKRTIKESTIDNVRQKMNWLKDSQYKFPKGTNITPLEEVCYFRISGMRKNAKGDVIDRNTNEEDIKYRAIPFDYDSSLWSTVVYELMLRSIGEKYLTQDLISKKYNSYYLASESNEKLNLFGDTMISYATVAHKYYETIDKKNLHKNEKYDIFKEYSGKRCILDCSWEACILDNLAYFEKHISPDFSNFLKVNHKLGNFIPLPVNRPYRLGDYWDLFMACVFNHFYQNNRNMQIKSYDLEIYKSRSRASEKYKEWLSNFGEGENGWKKFVEQNYLQDFVEESGRPCELWPGHFSENLDPGGNQYDEYFNNVYDAINKRGKKIAESIKKIS